MVLHTVKVMERRQHPRVELAVPVFAKTNRKVISGTTKDISAGGAFICCQRPFQSGEVFELLISTSLGSPPIKAIAEVVRSHNSCPDGESEPYGMAVQFIIISDADRKFISTIVSNDATNIF
jgi:c-di-GMP-binding flagellar brake protein YcgR